MSAERGRTVVRLWGEHDLGSLVQLDAALLKAVDECQGDVVVDLDALEFMDGSTLGRLLGCRARLSNGGRQFTVRAAPRCARVVFDACEVADLIEPAPTATGASDPPAATALGTWVTVPRDERPEAPVPARPLLAEPEPTSETLRR